MWILHVKLQGIVWWGKKKKESPGENAEVYAERKKVNEIEQKPVETDECFEEEFKKQEPELNEKRLKRKSTMKKQNLKEKKLKKQKMQHLKKNYRLHLNSMQNLHLLKKRRKSRKKL